MLVQHLQQTVIIKKLMGPKQKWNVGPELTDTILHENSLRNAVLNLPGPKLHKAITCETLANSP